MKITPIRTRVFRENERLVPFIASYISSIKERSILAVTSKIVALAEGRFALFESLDTKERLIKSESQIAIPTKYCWLTVKDGMVMASAGIDESNGNGKFILLPRDSFSTARSILRAIRKVYGLNEFGVIITDSRTMPLRAGVTGVALGYSGFKGIRDYRGMPDIFGRLFRVSRTDVADAIAASAVLVMGEGNEQQPLALIEDAPVEFVERTRRNELSISLEDDMYRPLFRA